MNEVEKSKMTLTRDNTKIREIEMWFRYEYIDRLNRIARHQYLGLPLPESRWDLEVEAYNKDNELRQLKGLPELPELKFRELI
jgi:hypothetical protein